MKRLVYLVMLSVLLMGCQDELHRVGGVYSYKISGTATASVETPEVGEIDLPDLNRTFPLTDEIGAMEIIPQKDNEMYITFNAMGGSVYVANATLEDNIITLEPFERTITHSGVNYDVTVMGEGQVLGKTIIFYLQYWGDRLTTDEVVMLAKKN